MVAYFERDKADKAIDVRVLIVEQPPGLPFNRGLMKNVGFDLLKGETDYVCFHDVDYLPMWADYSYPDKPSMLIGYGLEPAPVQQHFLEKPEKFFGGVVLLQNVHVERANGYSNSYWGWGHEDLDFIRRLDVVGLGRDYRFGTFAGLNHDRSDGHSYDAKGTLVRSPISRQNWDIFCARWHGQTKDAWRHDGLTSLRFTPIERAPINSGKTNRHIPIERVLVDFPHRPEDEGIVPTVTRSNVVCL
jgi:N-terminal domain of galactosyltransferase/N-terminal region of glycosyl transferase group 7